MTDLKRALTNIHSDLTSDEIDVMIEEAKQQVRDGENPEEVLHYEFGLEPDYVFDLID